MNIRALAFALIAASLVITSFATFDVENVEASNINYSIEKVNHTINVMYNGYILINDTIQINGTAHEGFLIGFPYKYGSHILHCMAYNATDVFPVSLKVPLENRTGFYGVKIDFPHGTPRVFTVAFILAPYKAPDYPQYLLAQFPANMSRYNLDFPEYPSLTRNAANCSVSIVLPEGSKYLGGTIENFTYFQENLPAFTYSPATVIFAVAEDRIQMVDIEKLNRQVTISGLGEIEGSDTYRITNKGLKEVTFIEVILPENTSSLSALDQLGRTLEVDVTEKTGVYKVSFRLPLKIEKSAVFTVKYHLLGKIYIEQEENKIFNVMFPLFQSTNYYINQSSTTFVLPEGARILSFENASVVETYGINRDVFQEKLVINRQGVFSLTSFDIEITYEYDLLWLPFRPTLWIWALATVGCAIAFIWKRPKAQIPVTRREEVAVGVRSEEIRSFIDAYERRRKIMPKTKALEIRARKGKISRRRYKVQRKTLQTRLNALSKKLADLGEKLQAAGGRYRDFMRQLEIAETQINEVEANIDSIETRHRRGELSLGAYRKLLSDYEQRKDKAEETINEILVRLREQTH